MILANFKSGSIFSADLCFIFVISGARALILISFKIRKSSVLSCCRDSRTTVCVILTEFYNLGDRIRPACGKFDSSTMKHEFACAQNLIFSPRSDVFCLNLRFTVWGLENIYRFSDALCVCWKPHASIRLKIKIQTPVHLKIKTYYSYFVSRKFAVLPKLPNWIVNNSRLMNTFN